MNQNNHSLSIIIPVYNEEKTLLDVLKKVQLLKKKCQLEIIIINDGSKDNSKNIIDKNNKLFNKAVHLTKNSGKGKAVIEGIKNCTYDYIRGETKSKKIDYKFSDIWF